MEIIEILIASFIIILTVASPAILIGVTVEIIKKVIEKHNSKK